MSLVLSPATEARIQAELATGRYAAPDELLNRALDSLNASLEGERAISEPTPQEMDDWLLRNKDAINAALDESFAAKERGESYSMEEAEAILAARRAAIVARLDESYAQSERGEGYSPEEARAILAERRAARRQ